MKVRTSISSILASLGFATFAVLLSGCGGYQLGSVKPEAYADIETIWVPTFENDTLEPRLAVIVTNAIITQLQQDGTYRIGTKDSSDVALRGRVRKLHRSQQRSANNNILTTQELALELEIAYYLENLQTGQKVKTRNPFGVDVNDRDLLTGQRRNSGLVVGRTTVFLDPNFQVSEREGLPLAAEDAAEQLVSFISEGW